MKVLFITFYKKEDQNKPNFFKFADYLSDQILHGLRELYGDSVIDYPGSWHLYKDEAIKRKLDTNIIFGKGFTYTNILDNYNNIDRDNIESKIKANYFDLIIYGSIRRSDLFLDLAIKSNSKIIFIDGTDDAYVEKKYLQYGLYFKREYVENLTKVKPISFSVPKSKILKSVDNHPKNIIAPLIPGKSKTYIYNTEEDYYKMYQKSIFGITYKKTGWDCLRHYEILMNGCIPLFLDIESCPAKTMESFPKEKMIDIKKKYANVLNFYNPFNIFIKKFQKKTIIIDYFKYLFSPQKKIEIYLKENPEIFKLKEELLIFVKQNLTTEINAKKLIDIINND